MASDNEQQVQDEQHSIWNGRFKANPKEGKFFLEIVDRLGAQFDGMPVEEIIQTFWGEDREVLVKLIKKANKREKKEEAKFAPKELKKAPSANILFQRDFKARCDKTGGKFDLKTCSEAYKALSDKEKAKYKKEAETLKAQYKAEYERLRNQAISNGEFPEDKPKKPLSGYFRFLADVRGELSERLSSKYSGKDLNSNITKEAGQMWTALDDAKKAKYELAYKKEKEVYDAKMKDWEAMETQRRKKQSTKNGAEPAEVNIETSKPKQVAKPATDTEDEPEPEQAKPKPKAKTVSSSTKKPAKATTDTEEEPENKTDVEAELEAQAKTEAKAETEAEPAKEVAKPKAKTTTKPKAK